MRPDLFVLIAPALRPLLEPLSSACRLIFLDEDAGADAVEELRVELLIDTIAVFGHAAGGLVAQEYALRFPASTGALIVVAGPPHALAGRIAAPALVIAGRDGALEESRRTFDEIPRAELLVFERSGDEPFRTQREAFVYAVGDWLGEHAADLGTRAAIQA